MANVRHTIENMKSTEFDNSRLLYISTSKYEYDWYSILHSHSFSELFFITNGSGYFVAEGEKFPIERNDLIIINPHVQHTEQSLSTSSLEYIVLGIEGLVFTLDGTGSQSDTAVLSATASGKVQKYKIQSSDVYAYLNIMLEEVSKKGENYETICQHLLAVLLIRILRHESLTIVPQRDTIANRECAQIKNYIDANYSDNITLNSLANMTHMNKYYMVHAFTKQTGLSPINYLMQKRLHMGKSLLESSNHSIADIAEMLGFSSQSYFSQAFKKAVGQTPAQYRRENRV